MFIFLGVLVFLAILTCAYVLDKVVEENADLRAELESRKKVCDNSVCCAQPPDPIIYPYGTLVDVYLGGKIFVEGVKVVGYYEGTGINNLYYRVKQKGHVNEVHHVNVRKHVTYEEKLDIIDEELERYRQELNSRYGIVGTPISRILKD